MLLSASSTARVMDLRCAAGNPSISASDSTAPRTAESNRGLLHNAIISRKPPGCRSRSVIGRGEVFMRDMGGLFGEVVGGLEIPAKEPDLAVYIARQDRLCIRGGELAMDRDGRSPGNGCHLAGPLAAGLESPDRAMENNQIWGTRGGAVAVAINMLECSLFLDLMNQIFIKRNLKFGREFDFVRLDHLNLDCRSLNFAGQVFGGLRRVLLVAGGDGGSRFSRSCGMRTSGQLRLDGIRGAHGHGEDRAVIALVHTAAPESG